VIEVLLVDDCPEIGAAVERALGPDIRVSRAGSLAQAQAVLERRDFDLVLLDLSLPDGDGLRLCSSLQGDPATAELPILFLSATRDVQTKVMALTLGADDYVEKPFAPEELRARVQTRLRKRAEAIERGEVLRRGVVTLEVPPQRVTIEEGDDRRDAGLTTTEFRLLFHLASRPGRVIAREQLMRLVWGDAVVAQRTIDSHLSNLRSKLGPVGGSYLQAVRGAGYRFEPK
jgi:two-component system OmpR family response regulator